MGLVTVGTHYTWHASLHLPITEVRVSARDVWVRSRTIFAFSRSPGFDFIFSEA